MAKRTHANQLSPLLENSPSHASSSPRTILPMTEDTQQPNGTSGTGHSNRCYTIFVDLINMLMCTAEIALVLYLTIDHFSHSMGVIAVAMLAPILLNFVGVTYFFSDQNERVEFERAGTSRFTRDMHQVPVLGPVVTAVKVLLMSTGLAERPNTDYERFEASAVKMREAQTFFSAAPEAMVQLAVLLNSNQPRIGTIQILEMAVVIVSIFTLAEANVYALRSNYFRLFHTYQEGEWRVHETFGRKCILFIHSFCSIGSRIAASACLIAAIQCYFNRPALPMHGAGMVHRGSTMRQPSPPSRGSSDYDEYNPPYNWGQGGFNSQRTISTTTVAPAAGTNPQELSSQLGFIMGVTFITLIFLHMTVCYIARLLRYSCMRAEIPGGCYESINYGWRSTILHTGFQSKNVATQLWFYIENSVMFTLWWFSVEYYGHTIVKQNTQLPMTLLFTAFTVLSLFFLFAAVGAGMHRLESPFTNNPTPTPPTPAPLPPPS